MAMWCSFDDKMDSEADASTGNEECKPSNINGTNAEVSAIIDIWANVEIQGQLECVETRDFSNVSEEMRARGFTRSYKQCRNKIKWLKHEYKQQ